MTEPTENNGQLGSSRRSTSLWIVLIAIIAFAAYKLRAPPAKQAISPQDASVAYWADPNQQTEPG